MESQHQREVLWLEPRQKDRPFLGLGRRERLGREPLGCQRDRQELLWPGREQGNQRGPPQLPFPELVLEREERLSRRACREPQVPAGEW